MAIKPETYRTLVQGLVSGHAGKLAWVSQDTTWRGLYVSRQRKETMDLKRLRDLVLVVLIAAVIVGGGYGIIHLINRTPAEQPAPATANQVSSQPLEYKLASIEYGTTTPPQELVNQFKDQLYKIGQVCPKNTEQQLSDYIVKAHSMITEKRPVFSLLEVSQGFYTSIPKNNTTANCSDFMAVYMALVLKGY